MTSYAPPANAAQPASNVSGVTNFGTIANNLQKEVLKVAIH
jgi:hypothetical protein